MHQIAKDITGVGKTEVHLAVAAPLRHVWDALVRIEEWPEFTELVESVRWSSAEPWALGSSFQAKITWPLPLSCTLVVTSFQPISDVRWMTLVMGIVIERWTRIVPHGHTTSLDSTTVYFAPSNPGLPLELGDLLPQFELRFFADLKHACESAMPTGIRREVA